jgi:hypothetical protein
MIGAAADAEQFNRKVGRTEQVAGKVTGHHPSTITLRRGLDREVELVEAVDPRSLAAMEALEMAVCDQCATEADDDTMENAVS